MRVQTVRELGSLARTARRAQGLTQADLANRLRVSRDWVVRLEKGSPRLETQKVLDALGVLGLTLDVANAQITGPTAAKKPAAKTRARSATTGRFLTRGGVARKSAGAAGTTRERAAAADKNSDPFAFLNERTS